MASGLFPAGVAGPSMTVRVESLTRQMDGGKVTDERRIDPFVAAGRRAFIPPKRNSASFPLLLWLQISGPSVNGSTSEDAAKRVCFSAAANAQGQSRNRDHPSASCKPIAAHAVGASQCPNPVPVRTTTAIWQILRNCFSAREEGYGWTDRFEARRTWFCR